MGCTGFSLLWLLLLRSTGSRACGLSSGGIQAYLPRGLWDLPGPGIEPLSPVLADGVLITGPSGKPSDDYILISLFKIQINTKTVHDDEESTQLLFF